MERRSASDFPQEVLNLFDKFVHGDIDRRAFLDGAKAYATTGVTAAMMLESLCPNFAWAQQVAKDDPRIQAGYETAPSPQGHGTVKGYFVRPAKAAKSPAVLVIHENRGLNPYIEDVARRLGTAGFLAFAPDALSSVGGYPGDEDKGRTLFAAIDKAKLTQDFLASAHWLKAHSASTGKLGAVGFCFGGGAVNMLATRLGAELAAGVPFYGAAAPTAEVGQIKAAMMFHFGELDTRINDAWPAYETALKQQGATYAAYVYPKANHGFHNDTTPRFDKEAADLAWSRTIEFFKTHLRG